MTGKTFDYQAEAEQTKSTVFHGDKVELSLFIDTLRTAISTLEMLDKMKKSLFYGKSNFMVPEVSSTCAQLPVGCLSASGEQESVGIDVLHAVLGIATEAGELLEAIEIGLFGEDGFDLVNVAEEIGDVFWYQAILANVASKSFEEIQATNIAKLRARFPNKFSEYDAQNRNLEKERQILEDGKDIDAFIRNATAKSITLCGNTGTCTDEQRKAYEHAIKVLSE